MPDRIHVLFVAGTGTGTNRHATDIDALEGCEDISVTVVGDLEGAVAAIGNGVDCLVVDHDPPAIDGLAVTAAVRDRVSRLPIVLWPAAGSASIASQGTVSHDLRNPLPVVHGSLSLAMDGIDSDGSEASQDSSRTSHEIPPPVSRRTARLNTARMIGRYSEATQRSIAAPTLE